MRSINRFLLLVALILSPSLSFAYSPIAVTDVVPYQRVEYGASFNFGVPAFSKPGIEKVEFIIVGQGYSGGVKTSTTMALNTRVASAEYEGVWEYYVTISASEFSNNGTITVTPKVTDNNSNVRDLDAVTLIVEGASADFDQVEAWVDIEGSDGTGTVDDENDPFPSIQSAITAAQTANGGSSSGNIIYLVEDTYSIAGISGSTGGEWLTITKAVSANRNNVIINDGTRTSSITGLQHLKFDNLTLQSQGNSLEVIHDNGLPSNWQIWTNSCRLIGSGRYSGSATNPVWLPMLQIAKESTHMRWSTDDYITDVYDAYEQSNRIRGAVIDTLMNDAMHNVLFAINVQVDDVDNGTTAPGQDGPHADILQSYQNDSGNVPVSNRLYYNVYATDAHYQGIIWSNTVSGGSHDNAYINVFIEMREVTNYDDGVPKLAAGLASPVQDHTLMWNCSFPYGHMTLGKNSTNSSYKGNLFWQLIDTEEDSNEWLYNHYMYANGLTGNCTIATNSVDDYHDKDCPRPVSVALDSGSSTRSLGGSVVDISTPGAIDFGYPVTDSDLINALPSVYVPVDALGNTRDSSPDIGALEYQGAPETITILPLLILLKESLNH